MTLVFIGIGVLILIGAGALAFQTLGKKQKSGGRQIPFYQRRSSLLSDNERLYYDTLLQVVGQKSLVFPKVRLADLVNTPPSSPHSFRLHWQRVQRRCVDFLVCTPANMAPALAIRMETRADRKRRMQLGPDVVDDVLDMSRIPLLRVEVEDQYDPARIARDIRASLARGHKGASMGQPGEESAQVVANPALLELAQERLPFLKRWTSVLWGFVTNNKHVKV